LNTLLKRTQTKKTKKCTFLIFKAFSNISSLMPLSSATSQTHKRVAPFCSFPVMGLLLPFAFLLQAGILQGKVEVGEILAPVNLSKPVSLGSPDGGLLVQGASGNQVAPPDSYAMFRHLMEAKASLTKPLDWEPQTVTKLKVALKTLLETVIHGFFGGFVPEVQRRRRAVGEEERGYLDTIFTAIGAVLGFQNCSEVVACRAGRMAADKLPGAAMAITMLETFVPRGLKSWFGLMRNGVMQREECLHSFRCSMDVEGEEAMS